MPAETGVPNALPDSEMPQSFEELPETDPRYQGKAEFELPASGTPSIPRLEDDTPAEPVVTDLLGD